MIWMMTVALAQDSDTDGVEDAQDNCPTTENPDQDDRDDDGVGDRCDTCLFLPNPGNADQDEDGVGDDCDNCPADANVDQLDQDVDGNGTACDADDDRRGTCGGGQALSVGGPILLLGLWRRRAAGG